MTNNWKFPDARLRTEQERQKLCKMLFDALLEIRMLGWQRKAEQAADLADAFHNVPVYLWNENFSFDFFRKFLESYHEKYPERGCFNYLKMLDDIVEKSDEGELA